MLKNGSAWPVLMVIVLLAAAGPAAAHPEILLQIGDVTRQIAADPQNALLYLKRGDLFRDHEDWPSALADFEHARKLDPGLRFLDFSEGRTRVESGHPRQAVPFLNRFLGREPGNAEGLALRGRALAELDNSLAAARDYDGAIRSRLDSGVKPPPDLFISRARALVAAGHPAEALAGLEEGLGLLGGPITLEMVALDVELALQRVEDALHRVDRLAASTAARPEPWLVRRGEILEGAGRLAESRQAYAAALEAIEMLPPARRRGGTLASLELKARTALEQMPSGGSQ